MIKIIALDIGGVIAYQDFNRLNPHQKYLLQIYQSKNYVQFTQIPNNRKIITEIESQIEDIYSKLYVLMDSTIETLEDIVQRQYKLSLWTNNRPAISKWLQESGILKYVDFKNVCNSYFMPNGSNKPNPRFYKCALKQLDVFPEQVLFVDDDIKNVIAAEKEGISSLHYTDTKQDLKSCIYQKIKILERK